MEQAKKIRKYKYCMLFLIIGLILLVTALVCILVFTPYLYLFLTISVAEAFFYLFGAISLFSSCFGCFNHFVGFWFRGGSFWLSNTSSTRLFLIALFFFLGFVITFFFVPPPFLWGVFVLSDVLFIVLLSFAILLSVNLVLIYNLKLALLVLEDSTEIMLSDDINLLNCPLDEKEQNNITNSGCLLTTAGFKLTGGWGEHNNFVYHVVENERQVLVIIGPKKSKKLPELKMITLKKEEKKSDQKEKCFSLGFTSVEKIILPNVLKDSRFRYIPLGESKGPLLFLGNYIFLLSYYAESNVKKRKMSLHFFNVLRKEKGWSYIEIDARYNPDFSRNRPDMDFDQYETYSANLIHPSFSASSNAYSFAWPYQFPESGECKIMEIRINDSDQGFTAFKDKKDIDYPSFWLNSEPDKFKFFLSRDRKQPCVFYCRERSYPHSAQLCFFRNNRDNDFFIWGKRYDIHKLLAWHFLNTAEADGEEKLDAKNLDGCLFENDNGQFCLAFYSYSYSERGGLDEKPGAMIITYKITEDHRLLLIKKRRDDDGDDFVYHEDLKEIFDKVLSINCRVDSFNDCLIVEPCSLKTGKKMSPIAFILYNDKLSCSGFDMKSGEVSRLFFSKRFSDLNKEKFGALEYFENTGYGQNYYPKRTNKLSAYIDKGNRLIIHNVLDLVREKCISVIQGSLEISVDGWDKQCLNIANIILGFIGNRSILKICAPILSDDMKTECPIISSIDVGVQDENKTNAKKGLLSSFLKE